jgi:hypothetical protein
MLQFTIKQAMDGAYNTSGYYIYLYRDGETVFYVGRSQSPLDRLMQHLALDDRGYGSSLGDIILDNLPESWEWTIELYTLAECLPFIEQHKSGFLPYYHRLLTSEQAYIEQLTENRTPLETKIITDQDWLEICRHQFQNYLYERLGDNAEKAMIEHYNPCLNILGRTQSNPLTDRYRKRKRANAGVKLD